MKDNNMTVVVSSCDRYEDVLPAFSEQFSKHWKDCEFDKVLVTESKPKLNNMIFDSIMAMGNETTWCGRLLECLKSIKSPYILLILDDFLIIDNVNSKKIKEFIDVLKTYNAASIKLEPLPSPQKVIDTDLNIGQYDQKAIYRVSAQITIWDRLLLIGILEDLKDEELWNFERRGSILSEKYDQPFLCTFDYEFPFIEVITSNTWIRSSYNICKAMKIKLDYSKRHLEPHLSLAKRCIKAYILEKNPVFFTNLKNYQTYVCERLFK